MTAGCGKDSENAGILVGDRSGVRGAQCESYMDCVVDLECVDGVCGIFGESTAPGSTPTCEFPKGDEGSSVPTSGGVVTTSSAPTSVPTSSPVPTSAPTSSPGVTSSSSTSSTAAEPEPEVPAACKNLPVEFRTLKNPYAPTDAAVVDAGKKLFPSPNGAKSCAGSSCHGRSGGGNGIDGGSDFTTQDSKNRPDCIMYYYTAKGIKDVMPDYEAALSEDEIWKVLTYIRSLSL